MSKTINKQNDSFFSQNGMDTIKELYNEIIYINWHFLRYPKNSKIRNLKDVAHKYDVLLDLLNYDEKRLVSINYNRTFDLYMILLNCVTYFNEQAQYLYTVRKERKFDPSYERTKALVEMNQFIRNNESKISKETIIQHIRHSVERINSDLKELIK